MADTPPNFASGLDQNNFQIQGLDSLNNEANSIHKATDAVGYDWSTVNQYLDLAGTQAANYMSNAKTGKNVYQGQETALNQQDLGAGANGVSPATLGQALAKLSHGGAAQAGAVGAAQGAGQQEMMQKGLAEQQQIIAQRAAMMQSEMKLQAQKFAVNNSVAQTQQGLQLAQTHLTNMYNNAVANATNSTQYAQIQADMASFNNIMDYVKSGLGAAASVSAAGANYIKQNPSSAFSMALNPSNVWSSGAYNSGQYATPVTYDAAGNTNSVQGNGTYGGATAVDGVSDAGSGGDAYAGDSGVGAG